MFTIDLLKGRGIPIKRRPWGVAIATLAFLVPMVAAVVMVGFYISDRIVIRVTGQEIANYEKNIATFSDAVKLRKSFEAEKNNINKCLSEVLSSIDKHTQWSPVLRVVAENMPDSMILTRLEVNRRSVRKRVPQKDDPKQMIDTNVLVNTLRMNVTGGSQTNGDREVKDFKDRLRFSTLLADELEDIKVSRQPGTLGGRDVASYEINCIFKPKL